ncbi:MAG: hypothetical protein AAFP19_22870, partial [Bacteroidota bacterium]
WNASLGKNLFENEQGEISLSIFDALGQNRSINRVVNELYVEDTQNTVLQRYVMLSFRYQFKNFNTGKVKTIKKDETDGPPFMRG